MNRIDRWARRAAVRVRTDENLGVRVPIGVGDHGVLVPGARGAERRVQDLSGRALINAREAFVRIHGLRRAVSFEIEHRRAGTIGGKVLRRRRPANLGRQNTMDRWAQSEVEEPVEVPAGRREFGASVIVEIADREEARRRGCPS